MSGLGHASSAASEVILDASVVERRILLLGMLQSALADLGVQAALARHHRLVLSSADNGWSPCGLTDPSLHVFVPGGMRKAVTDGMVYRLDGQEEHPVSDPSSTAFAICGRRAARRRN